MIATVWNTRLLAGALLGIGCTCAVVGAWSIGFVITFSSILAAMWSIEIAKRERIERVVEELRSGRIAVVRVVRDSRNGRAS